MVNNGEINDNQLIDFLLSLPTNSTYHELSLIGSSCQHVHPEVLNRDDVILIAHIITFISSFFDILAFYCILTKSSQSMGLFKWCLFNLQLIVITDVCGSLLIIPRFSFPTMGGRSFGILFKWGLTIPQLIYIGFGCVGGMIASVALLFIYRHQAVVPQQSSLKFSKLFIAIWVAINYLLYVNMTLPALFTAPQNQLSTKIEILRKERCPPKDILHSDVYVLQDSFSLFPYLFFLIVFVGIECGLLAFHSAWLLFFSTLTQKLSRRTRKMQIKFLLALFAQIAIPTTLCYAPILYCVITTIVDHYFQFANDICLFVFVTHGAFSSFCLLLFYDCYRDFLIFSLFKNPFSYFTSSRVSSIGIKSENTSVQMTIMI